MRLKTNYMKSFKEIIQNLKEQNIKQDNSHEIIAKNVIDDFFSTEHGDDISKEVSEILTSED